MDSKRKKYVALAFISIAWLIIFIGRVTAPTLLKDIISDLNITSYQAGWAMTSLWLFYGIMQFPGGALSDAKGRKNVIILSLILFGVSVFLISITFNYIVLIITFSLLGFGAGFLPSPSLTMISEIFGPEKGKALGIRSAVTGLSGLVPFALPFITLLIGWREVFVIWGIIAFLIAFLFYNFVEESLKERESRDHLDNLVIGLKGLLEPNIFLMFIINLIVSFTWIGMMSWFPTYIQEAKGFSKFWSSSLYALILTGGLVIKPVLGHISDKVNKLFIMLVILINAAVAVYLLTIANSIIPLIIVSLLIAQTSAFYPIRTSYVMDIWHSKEAGTKYGVFRTLIIILASPISAVIGWTKEAYSFDSAILLIGVGLVLGAVLISIKIISNRCSFREQC
ncbi:MAG: MFS transporter [Thermoplasmatota archaeon]